MLKRNSKKILDIIAGQEAQNASQAYKMVHKEASDLTARNNVSQLLKKPEAQIYLQRHTDKARNRVVELVDSSKEEVALNASKDVLDRVFGKATQRTETHSTVVNLNLSLQDVTDNKQ